MRLCACIVSLLLITTPARAETLRLVAHCVNVVDGDTIEVRFQNGIVDRVRFADIDAPERNEPWGPEATAYVQRAVFDRDVMLEIEAAQQRDTYRRLLAVVYLHGPAEDVDIAPGMLSLGLAKVAGFADNHDRLPGYLRVQEIAKQEGLGIWLAQHVRDQLAEERLEAAAGRKAESERR